MKVIYPDRVTSITASTSDSSYPATNMLDEHPQRIWKATGQTATLTVHIANGNAIAFFNTNATSISMVQDNGITMTWGTGWSWDSGWSWDVPPDTPVDATYLRDDDGVGALWADYTEMPASHTLSVTLETDESQVEVGVIVAGNIYEFNEPSDLNEQLHDYSVKERTNNNSLYIIDDSVVRIINMSFYGTSEVQFRKLIHEIFKVSKSHPLAWNISPATDTWHYIIYAWPKSMPIGRHVDPNNVLVTLQLEEAI